MTDPATRGHIFRRQVLLSVSHEGRARPRRSHGHGGPDSYRLRPARGGARRMDTRRRERRHTLSFPLPSSPSRRMFSRAQVHTASISLYVRASVGEPLIDPSIHPSTVPTRGDREVAGKDTLWWRTKREKDGRQGAQNIGRQALLERDESSRFGLPSLFCVSGHLAAHRTSSPRRQRLQTRRQHRTTYLSPSLPPPPAASTSYLAHPYPV